MHDLPGTLKWEHGEREATSRLGNMLSCFFISPVKGFYILLLPINWQQEQAAAEAAAGEAAAAAAAAQQAVSIKDVSRA